ncbi:DUF3810 domain-containing protein [uncultured Tenacibaculum sp.]|uniref:DUF3810 domain-containing protein n=1 Tax=uncultured Tenacibaculum sp. TaxID=174713 RepID=UPI0026299870|nr:DUF3810 domain-containing protein [uncultured Tenacibaculum sp.]
MKLRNKHLFLAILLPIQYFIVQFLSQKSTLIEEYYSNGIYPYISRFLRILLGWLPFSFGDLLGLILIVLLIQQVYKLVRNRFRGILSKLVQFVGVLSIIYFCFYCFWGLNYFRKPLAENLGLQQSKYTTEQLVRTTKKTIEIFNKIHFDITQNDTLKIEVPYSSGEIYDKVPAAYKKVAFDYPQLAYKSPAIKNSLVSLFQSYNGTAGYLNPITGEAQVNSMLPKAGYPATTCHEVAHQIGWSAENDANFLGFLACTYSDDIYFNYSGYRMAFRYCMREIRKRDKELYKELWKTVNKGIKKELNDNYLFWKKYENPIEPYIKKGYNSYLKANNQSKGIESYSYVVDLLIAYFEQK